MEIVFVISDVSDPKVLSGSQILASGSKDSIVLT